MAEDLIQQFQRIENGFNKAWILNTELTSKSISHDGILVRNSSWHSNEETSYAVIQKKELSLISMKKQRLH